MAQGSSAADELVSSASGTAWSRALLGRAPDTDVWDCTAALVRRRASQSLVEAMQAPPWTAERPAVARRPSTPALQNAMM